MKPIPCYCGRTRPMFWMVYINNIHRERFTTKKEALEFIKNYKEEE